MDSPFQPGDVVQLKSAGERMTVETVEESPYDKGFYVFAVWMSTQGELQHGRFYACTLTKGDG
jgi:uncharacterized protein YodC (DUF2158 family)